MTMTPWRLCYDTFAHRMLIRDRRVPIEQALIEGGEKPINGRDVRAYCHG
jgi:hypothetical protein